VLNGGFGVNINIEQLKLRLGLPKPKPTPYNLRMANQTITRYMFTTYLMLLRSLYYRVM
jgi:hypothetical protein